MAQTSSTSWSRLTWVVRGSIVILLLVLALPLGFLGYCTWAPGEARVALLVPLDANQKELAARLERHVKTLSETIGPRNDEHPKAYAKAQAYLEQQLTSYGYEVKRYRVTSRGQSTWYNLEVTSKGKQGSQDQPVVVVGAHYDSCHDTPGADDNASGVAVLLELAKLAKSSPHSGTLRFELFPNEEPPHFQTASMGGLQYAQMAAKRGDKIKVMYSLEMLGYFDPRPNTQHYPMVLSLFYPDQGDFLAFVSTLDHRELTHQSINAFRQTKLLPSESFTGPTQVQGIDYSDHWSFWQAGYPGVMVTDTSFFRTKHYHQDTDLPGTLDYPRMTRVTEGLWQMLQNMTGNAS